MKSRTHRRRPGPGRRPRRTRRRGAGPPSRSGKAQPTRTPHANKPKVKNGCLLSVPDPGTTTPVKICYTIFRPARAKNRHKIPMLMHSHGWAGQRTTDAAKFKRFLDAGYAVISFDQRGFGESGGHAYVENPDVEGHDVRALVDLVARFPWVKKDRPGDPRLGAIGGSYGGGYQFLGAFEELRAARPADLRRARARDHLARPGAEPRAQRRRPHRVGAGPERRGGAQRRAAAVGLQGARRGLRDRPASRTARSPGTENL